MTETYVAHVSGAGKNMDIGAVKINTVRNMTLM